LFQGETFFWLQTRHSVEETVNEILIRLCRGSKLRAISARDLAAICFDCNDAVYRFGSQALKRGLNGAFFA